MSPIAQAAGVIAVSLSAMWLWYTSRSVPNALTLPGALLGLAAGIWAGAFTEALTGAAVGLGLLLPLFILGHAGAGDVKLTAALGAWLGFPLILQAGLCMVVVALLIAVGLMIRRRTAGRVAQSVAALALSLWAGDPKELALQPTMQSTGRTVPVVVVAALGAVAALALQARLG